MDEEHRRYYAGKYNQVEGSKDQSSEGSPEPPPRKVDVLVAPDTLADTLRKRRIKAETTDLDPEYNQ